MHVQLGPGLSEAGYNNHLRTLRLLREKPYLAQYR
jgi:hypothetical protein